MSKYYQDHNGLHLGNDSSSSKLTRTRNLLIFLICILSTSLFYYELVYRHQDSSDTNSNLAATTTNQDPNNLHQISPPPPPSEASSAESEEEDQPNTHLLSTRLPHPDDATPGSDFSLSFTYSDPTNTPCTNPGWIYGSCTNDARYFQCSPTTNTILAYPCPAGEKFFCTGENVGGCDLRSSSVGNGWEMKCDVGVEMGSCGKNAQLVLGYE